MTQENVALTCGNTAKHISKQMTGKATHTYDLWKKRSSAECAGIMTKATEVMNLISGISSLDGKGTFQKFPLPSD